MKLNEKFEVHSTLNPKLWAPDDTLKPEIAEHLTSIANDFIDSIEAPIHVADIRIVGSNASYNWTNESDLDMHVVANYDLVEADPSIIDMLYNALKTKYNNDYDLSIKGIPVELYIENINSSAISNGVYSLKFKKWIKEPLPIKIEKDFNTDADLAAWKKQVKLLVSSQDTDRISNSIDSLYAMRQSALANDGEYSYGNQLFKDIRNAGLLDELRTAYKAARSKQLSLESLLLEDSRNKLISKSKQSQKGFERYKKRVKSRIASTVKQYNSIDMNKLFKQDILTVDIKVQGETDDYIVKITFGGFLQLLKDQMAKQDNKLDLKAVTRALVLGFNKDDVYINCSCPDFAYRYAYHSTKNKTNSGEAELRPSDITNPDDSLGSGCKHILLVLSNTSWILKCASVIYNYVNYMEKHYQKLYADIIYPAIYGKDYEEPVQLTIDDSDELDTSSDMLDKSNQYAVDKTRFQKGNTQGIRFAPKLTDEQITIDDNIEQAEE